MPTVGKTNDEGVNLMRRIITAGLLVFALTALCGCNSYVPPSESPTSKPVRTPGPNPVLPTPDHDKWKDVTAVGLPRKGDSDYTYKLTECNGVLYAYDNEKHCIYTLGAHRWELLKSYEALVDKYEERPLIHQIYSYEGMLFLFSKINTFIRRANGSWFTLTSLDWLDSGNYNIRIVDESSHADGLYAISPVYGNILRFENERWEPMPKLPIFDYLACYPDGGPPDWPQVFTCGKDTYVYTCETRDDNSVLIYRFDAATKKWQQIIGPAAITHYTVFNNKLYIVTKDKKLYCQENNGWTDITQDTISTDDKRTYHYFRVHDGSLYTISEQAIYRLESGVWVDATEGIPNRDMLNFMYMYSAGGQLYLGDYQTGWYRMGPEKWERLDDKFWEETYNIWKTNNMVFACAYDGWYRLYPDGTTEFTTVYGVHINSNCDIFAYDGGYISEYTSTMYLHRGKDEGELLNAGLPSGEIEDAKYVQAGDDLYALSFNTDSRGEYISHWEGTRWETVRYMSNDKVVVFQDSLYVYDNYNRCVQRITDGLMMPTRGFWMDWNCEAWFEQKDGNLYIHGGDTIFQLVDGLYWQAIAQGSDNS